MSTSSFTGTIKNFSPKPSEDYYGILIDNGQEDKWLNGRGDPNDSWSKGDKVKVETNQDRFIDIQKIDVMESGDSEADANVGGSDRQDSPMGENTGSSNIFIPPEQQVALKKAVDASDIKPGDDTSRHVKQVSKLATGYYNILKDMGDE